MDKKIFLIPAVLTIFIFGFCFVSAHETKVDGTLTAILHIEPADSPEANSTSTLELIFQDDDNIFNLDKCNCEVSVSKDQNVIFTTPLHTLEIPFLFPEIGNYTVNLKGEPANGGTFRAFEFSFDVNVIRSQNQFEKIWNVIKGSHFFHEGHWIHILIFGIGFAVCIYVIVTDKKKIR